MIDYDLELGVCFVLRCAGSVFPKALLWALPNAIVVILLHTYARPLPEIFNVEGAHTLWAGYTSILGFLMVFRNNQAYTRFWEGATMIHQVRGEWFNAVSTLFTFSSHAPELQEQVQAFHQTLVHLASLLHSSALQQVCDLEDDRLEVLEHEGMDPECLTFLQTANDKCEMLMLWITRLIVDCDEAKVIKVAPPLLTRVFQELAQGMVHLNNARKIKEVPFPYPYAQMIHCMLIVHWLAQPILASHLIESRIAAAMVCFFVTFSLWSLIYIALEIDQPFGDDANDLPLKEMQKDFNKSLIDLLHPLAQRVPRYNGTHPHLRVVLASGEQSPRRKTHRKTLSAFTGVFGSETVGHEEIDDVKVYIESPLPSPRGESRETSVTVDLDFPADSYRSTLEGALRDSKQEQPTDHKLLPADAGLGQRRQLSPPAQKPNSRGSLKRVSFESKEADLSRETQPFFQSKARRDVEELCNRLSDAGDGLSQAQVVGYVIALHGSLFGLDSARLGCDEQQQPSTIMSL